MRLKTYYTIAILAWALVFGLVLADVAKAERLYRGDGMVYDDVLDITLLTNTTQVMQTTAVPWDWARHLVDKLEYADRDDWRLPSKEEMLYILRDIAPSTPGPFTNLKEYYWTKEESPLLYQGGLAIVRDYNDLLHVWYPKSESIGQAWAVIDGDIWNPVVPHRETLKTVVLGSSKLDVLKVSLNVFGGKLKRYRIGDINKDGYQDLLLVLRVTLP